MRERERVGEQVKDKKKGKQKGRFVIQYNLKIFVSRSAILI